MPVTLETSGTPAEIYERYMVPAIFAQWAADLIDSASVQPGERVLDVACGTGVVTRRLAERVGVGGRVVGLDLNPVMLATARVAAERANVEWLERNAMNRALPDAAFDAVVCQQGLQFIPDKLAALREMRRVLVPGRRLALSVWRSVDQAPGYRVFQEALARRLGPGKAALPPFGRPDGRVIRAMVTSARFREVGVHAEVKISRFPSAEYMVRSIAGRCSRMLGTLVEQGPDALTAIATEVAEATRAYFDDAGWATPVASNVITARA